MQTKPQSANFTVPLLVAALLVAFNVSAQETPQSSSQPSVQSQPQSSPNGVTMDPSAGPLRPSGIPTSEAPLPDGPVAPATAAPAPPQSSRPSAQSPTPEPRPLGAAAAEGVKTAGGAASRPAGNAIAPARQHQYRSLLIKLGAVAAAGIAVGTVYGLSRATPSTPPHSTVAAIK